MLYFESAVVITYILKETLSIYIGSKISKSIELNLHSKYTSQKNLRFKEHNMHSENIACNFINVSQKTSWCVIPL